MEYQMPSKNWRQAYREQANRFHQRLVALVMAEAEMCEEARKKETSVEKAMARNANSIAQVIKTIPLSRVHINIEVKLNLMLFRYRPCIKNLVVSFQVIQMCQNMKKFQSSFNKHTSRCKIIS